MNDTNNEQPIKKEKKVTVFITYAWDGEEHNERVLTLTNHLRQQGFEAENDKLIIQNSTSTDLQKMMYDKLTKADKVVIVLNKEYAKKANAFEGGVGIEYEYILKDIDVNQNKYILVSFDSYRDTEFPIVLRKREMVSLTDAANMDVLYQKLLGHKNYIASEVASCMPVFVSKKVAPFEFKPRPQINITELENTGDEPEIFDDVEGLSKDLQKAIIENNKEQVKLLIKMNSFLLYDVYERKGSALPIFHNLLLGTKAVDFTWLDDASGGPIWFLVKVSDPFIQLFDDESNINPKILSDIEEVKSWENYLNMNPGVVKDVFGAAHKFKYRIIIGSYEEWQTDVAQKWRAQHNRTSEIEIRSYNTFTKSIAEIQQKPDLFYRFNQFHSTSPAEDLRIFWKEYGYMNTWRKWL